MKYKGILIE